MPAIASSDVTLIHAPRIRALAEPSRILNAVARKRTFRASAAPSRVRGKLVESIVAAMHEVPGVQVRQNVWLPPISGNGRSREIDVLIDGVVAGYPIRIPIECKNEKAVIKPEKIDAFVGKLQYVGLAQQQGIYISVKGFTKGARERAKAAGIRTLLLTGLTAERLEASVLEAMQAVVYLWPVATEWSVLNDIGHDIKEPAELNVYLDENGTIVGSNADLAWRAWYEGRVPESLGIHEVALRLPKGWKNVVAGNMSVPERITVTFHVFGIAMSMSGKANRHALLDAETSVVEKLRLRASFDNSTASKPEVFSSEEDLRRFLSEGSASIRVTTRVRLPRIQWRGVFWPLSIRVATALNQAFASEASEGGRAVPLDVEQIEGPSLANMWEPLWVSPLLKGILEASFDEDA